MPNVTEQKSLWLPILFLASAAALALYLSRPPAFQIRWNDETLYFTVAKNIYFEGDFNSHHYLSESLLKKGYPTKDTHPPGYPLLMAASFLFLGSDEAAPYFLNYLFLVATLLLIFFLGRELKDAATGTLGALLFLLNPLSLSLTQSIMSELSAALAVTWLFFLLVMLEDGIVKGLFLAFGISLATLIKPFLLVMLPACLLFIGLSHGPSWRRTLATLAIATLLLGIFVVHPLSSNREYYPSSINDLFLQPGLKVKLEYGFRNFAKNFRLTRAMGWKSGELAFLGLGLLYISLPLAAALRKKILWRDLYVAAGLAFLITLLAVFFIYEFPAWRGSRALFAFFPILGLIFCLGLADLGPRALGLSLAAAFCAINAYYLSLSFEVLEKSKLRQTAILSQYFSRTDKNLNRFGLKPKVMLSTNNLLLAVGRYPIQVILSEPRSLADFSRVEALLPPDVLELRPGGPLFQANLRAQGEAERFGSNYEFAGEGDGFYYYRRR